MAIINKEAEIMAIMLRGFILDTIIFLIEAKLLKPNQ